LQAVQAERDRARRPFQFREVDFASLFGSWELPEVFPVSYLYGGSTVPDYMLLNLLAKAHPGCEYLEIGTWRGESILNVARYSKHCVSLSLSETQLRAYGLEHYVETAGFYCKRHCPAHVELIGADSMTFDFKAFGRKFDVIFVDGDHAYDGIVNDTQKVLPLLRDDDSVLVWHDYAGSGGSRVVSATSQAIRDAMPPETHACIYGVRHTMCAVYTKKPVESWEKRSIYARPERAFRVTAEVKEFD
jgi:hypothetical protein